jgi:FAD-dependent urate hydroxylase
VNLGSLRILVVGAGIAGLALARALHRHDCRPDIIERRQRWDDMGSGLFLPGNAVRALRALDLGAAVEEQSARIETQRFCDHRGRLLSQIDLDSFWGATGPCIGVHRGALHAALREWHGAPPIRLGLTLTSLVQATHGVTAHLSDGTRETYDLVVGSDGIRSSVRSLLFGNEGPRGLDQWGWRFVLPLVSPAPSWSLRMTRRSACLTVPLGVGRTYCYIDLIGAAAAPSMPAGDEQLGAVLAGFSDLPIGLADLALGDATRHSAAIEEVVLDRYSNAGVVLIGGAAHATGPNMAQGAAMALEDALVLTRCLCECPSIAQAMKAYEALRRPRLTWVRRMTRRRDRIRRLHPTLRNGLLRAFGRRVYGAHYRPLLTEP